MDFSKFSDDHFEAKQWVNAALKRKDENTELDVRIKLECCVLNDKIIWFCIDNAIRIILMVL